MREESRQFEDKIAPQDGNCNKELIELKLSFAATSTEYANTHSQPPLALPVAQETIVDLLKVP